LAVLFLLCTGTLQYKYFIFQCSFKNKIGFCIKHFDLDQQTVLTTHTIPQTTTTTTTTTAITTQPTTHPTTLTKTIVENPDNACQMPQYIYVLISVLSVYSFTCSVALKVVFILYKKKHGSCFTRSRAQIKDMELPELPKARTSAPNLYSLPPMQSTDYFELQPSQRIEQKKLAKKSSLSAVNSLSPTTNTLIEIHEYEYLKCID
jgi:hypothetical protein